MNPVSMSDHQSLIERVEGLSGPDRGVDYVLANWFGSTRGVPSYTASIDAALSLVERKLGWSWRLGNLPSGKAFCVLGTSRVEHIAATPALALILALLRSLPLKEEG